jgi:hypothetical protein
LSALFAKPAKLRIDYRIDKKEILDQAFAAVKSIKPIGQV